MSFGAEGSRDLPVVRVFVSSTFSDLIEERNALAEHVWPELEQICRQRGFTFQAIDLRWGVPGEAGLDHRTMQICLEELRRAQTTSPRPNFLILLGDKYGWRPLPECISEAEFHQLSSAAVAIDAEIESLSAGADDKHSPPLLTEHEQAAWNLRQCLKAQSASAILATWYRRDGNAQPAKYLLRARTDSPDTADYTQIADTDGRRRDTQEWLDVQQVLWAVVNLAYPPGQLAERFSSGTDRISSIVRFQASATEQEIWHGALQVENARDHVVACFRTIDRSHGEPCPEQLQQFVDLHPDGTPDLAAADALRDLRSQLNQVHSVDASVSDDQPVIQTSCRWRTDTNGHPTGQLTTGHLNEMCQDILSRMRPLVLQQISDYWGEDLSADEASLGQVDSQRRLDIELRDHGRFAAERGPLDLFVGREEEVRQLRDYLQSTDNGPLIVHGPSGSGKTALLSYVAQQPREEQDDSTGFHPIIIQRFIGAHPESSNLRSLLASLCQELRRPFPVDEPLPDSPFKLTEEFYAQLGHATLERPVYVFLDALDQLEPTDAALDVNWLRSTLVMSADNESPAYARLIATCLSPSIEFPEESEPCRPFRHFRPRQLLADEELGVLPVDAARQLLRDWMSQTHRDLKPRQWLVVDDALNSSSDCRQPLYLKTLCERLRSWREFDAVASIPLTLTELLRETLEELSLPQRHGNLPRIALSYLVSARYGLSEGELLEVLFRDPAMIEELEKSRAAYGHELPPHADRLPIAPWARLQSDLRMFLTERSAPGTTVLSCYHRQFEQAIQTLFFPDESVRQDRQQRLADYFDTRWDQPDPHALMELPDLLLNLPDHQRLYARLTYFSFPMRKAEVGFLEPLVEDYERLLADGSIEVLDRLSAWHDFLRTNTHILRRGLNDGTCHKILHQLAVERANDSPPTIAAEKWLTEGRCDWLRLQRVPRPENVMPSRCIAVLEGHTDWVDGAIVLTESRILSWSKDRTLRLWNATTGICTGAMTGNEWVEDVQILPDGQTLSWSSNENTLRIWEITTGVCTRVLEGHSASLRGVRVLRDSRILSWSKDCTLRIWDAATGVCTCVLEGHAWPVSDAQVLPDGRILSRSGGDDIRTWDASTGECVSVLQGQAREVLEGQAREVLVLPGGQILSRSGNDSALHVRDTFTGESVAVMEGHSSWVRGAMVLPEGKILSWSNDMTLRVWELSGACHAVLGGHRNWVSGALALSDGRILSWSGDRTLRIWDSASGQCIAVLDGHTDELNGVQLIPHDRIVSWSRDRTLRIWDSMTGGCTAVLKGHTCGVQGVKVLPDGRILSWAGGVNSAEVVLRIWDIETGNCAVTLRGHTSSVQGAHALSDGRILSWSWDGTLRIWDVGTQRSADVQYPRSSPVSGMRVLSDDRMISWSGHDESFRVWDVTTGNCADELHGNAGQIRGVALLPDGRFLSRSKEGNSVRIWNGVTADCTTVLDGHEDHVAGMLVLEGNRVVSWSWDKTLRLWDADSGECMATMRGHTQGGSQTRRYFPMAGLSRGRMTSRPRCESGMPLQVPAIRFWRATPPRSKTCWYFRMAESSHGRKESLLLETNARCESGIQTQGTALYCPVMRTEYRGQQFFQAVGSSPGQYCEKR